LSYALVVELVDTPDLGSGAVKIVWVRVPPSAPMAKQKITKKQTADYILFLEKRLASKNYKANVSKEEFDKTKAKLDKARLQLKLL
jgi:hypothetical protein